MNDRYIRFEKRGNTQGGKKEPPKKEDCEKNGADFISIIDRMLLDPHAGSRRISGFLWSQFLYFLQGFRLLNGILSNPILRSDNSHF